MLLRRLTNNLKEQNWTAIVIEFVLLVVGVFLGIQVANWNETRNERLREQGFLDQLRDEIAGNVETIEAQMRYQEAVISGGRRGLEFIAADGDCQTGCEGLLIDFFHASQFWGTPYARAKYDENRRLGFPSDPVTRAAVDSFYFYIDGWDAVTASAPAFRERVRGYFRPEAADRLWRDCWRSPVSHLEELHRDCEDALKDLDSAGMLAEIRADPLIRTELNFWLGQNIFASHAFPLSLDYARSATKAISEALEDAP